MRISRFLARLVVVAMLALIPIPASSMTCVSRCGVSHEHGVVCYTCCECCLFIDGSTDCVCSSDCQPF
jgi:hypothetical protein